MRLEVHMTRLYTDEHEMKPVEVPDTITIRELIELPALGHPLGAIDYSRYYPVLTPNLLFSHEIPYFLENGRVRWMVDDHAVTVREFLAAHPVEGNRLYLNWWLPFGGGPGWVDIITAWQRTYEVLEKFDVVGDSTVIVVQIIRATRNRLQRTRHRSGHRRVRRKSLQGLQDVWPSHVFDFIGTRTEWNASELTDMINNGITQDAVKHLLASVQYRFDAHRQMYVSTARTKDAMSAVSHVRMNADWDYYQHQDRKSRSAKGKPR